MWGFSSIRRSVSRIGRSIGLRRKSRNACACPKAKKSRFIMTSKGPISVHGKGDRKWIQRVIRKPGALRKTVLDTYGRRGFDKKGRIRCDVLEALTKKGGKTAKRAQLALRLRGITNVPCPVRR